MERRKRSVHASAAHDPDPAAKHPFPMRVSAQEDEPVVVMPEEMEFDAEGWSLAAGPASGANARLSFGDGMTRMTTGAEGLGHEERGEAADPGRPLALSGPLIARGPAKPPGWWRGAAAGKESGSDSDGSGSGPSCSESSGGGGSGGAKGVDGGTTARGGAHPRKRQRSEEGRRALPPGAVATARGGAGSAGEAELGAAGEVGTGVRKGTKEKKDKKKRKEKKSRRENHHADVSRKTKKERKEKKEKRRHGGGPDMTGSGRTVRAVSGRGQMLWRRIGCPCQARASRPANSLLSVAAFPPCHSDFGAIGGVEMYASDARAPFKARLHRLNSCSR